MPRRSIATGTRVRIAEGRNSGVVGIVMPASVLPKRVERPTKSEVVVAQEGTGRLFTAFKGVLGPMPPLNKGRHGDWHPGPPRHRTPPSPFPRAFTEPRRDAHGLVTFTFNFYGGASAEQLAQRLRWKGIEATGNRDLHVRGAIRAQDWMVAASRINRTVNFQAIQTAFNLRPTAPRV